MLGVATITGGVVVALARFAGRNFSGGEHAYTKLRHEMGKAILLGLEILVAADIVATVVTEFSMDRVFTLGLIVLIRTFLSFSLQAELEGKFPWQQRK